jgi:hypothetical protein
VLFTDLANYTAHVRSSDREGIRRLIADHESRVAALLERHGGQVVKNMGDSFLILFHSATDAVRAGMGLLTSLESIDDFKIRIAIATGDVEEISGDYFGDAVNLASRILSVTPVNQIWFSLSTYLSMNKSEIAWEEAGSFSFKGFYGDIKVFRTITETAVWLPAIISKAIREFDLVIVKPDLTIPRMNHDSIVLLLQCPTGGEELDRFMGQLPVIPPSQVWHCGYRVPPADRWAWSERGSGWVIGRSEIIEQALEKQHEQAILVSSSMTMFLDKPKNAYAGLVLRGLALPRTPLSEVVQGYFYCLRSDGDWVNTEDGAILRLSINPQGATIVALANGIQLNRQLLPMGSKTTLNKGDKIMAPCGELAFISFDTGPYVGLLVGGASAPLPILVNTTVEIGREPSQGGFFLIDRKGQQNIQWCSGQRAVRAKQNGFTLDRALAGRRQAQLMESAGCLWLRHLHEHCPTYVLNEDLLSPVVQSRKMNYEEMIITGTSVLSIREGGA